MVSPFMEHGDAFSYVKEHPEVDRLKLVCFESLDLQV